jgi:hypothetical protein
MDKIGKIDTISTSAISPPVYFPYILIIPNILIFILSLLYNWNMSTHSIQKLKVLKREKRDNKIEKKEQKITKTREKEEISSQIEEPTNKKFNVRCPQCKHIFTAEKEGEIIKIKCPKCYKGGIIK